MKILSLILLSIFSFQALSFTSHLTSPIVDEHSFLTKQEKAQLDQEIRQVYNEAKGPQLVVLVVDTLNDTPIEDYAHKAFTTWKLGDKQRDDGVLFVVAINDRKMRIEVGQGLEGSLTDYDSKRILSKVKPFFKKEEYGQGIRVGTQEILKFIKQENAVQAPANYPKEKKVVREVKMTTIDSEKIIHDSTVFLFVLPFIITALIWILTKRFLRNRMLYKESEDKRKAIESRLTHPLENLVKEVSTQIHEQETQLASIEEGIVASERKKPFCPLIKKEQLEQLVREEEFDLRKIHLDIEHYKQAIKAGK